MKRWLNAQRIGLAAFFLRQFSTSPYAAHFEDALLEEMTAYLRSSGVDRVNGLRTLPTTSLFLLQRAPDLDGTCDMPGVAQDIEEALSGIRSAGDGGLVAKCNVFTHHVFHGAANARGISTIARDLFTIPRQRRLRLNTAQFRRLEEVLMELRSTDLPTETRLANVPEFVHLLMDDPIEAAQVENALFHHIFCWPLLVFGETTLNVAVSVPVVVDARFDDDRAWRQAAQFIGNDAYVSGTEQLDISSSKERTPTFKFHLSKAVRVARELWLSAHGHTGDWRHVVKTVPIVFDFSHCTAVVKGLVSRLGLDDGSAGAYFAQVVLARLLGRTTCLSSAMTGGIGDQVVHPGGTRALDYRVEVPDDVPKKLRWVFESHMFERVIIPDEENLNALLGQTFVAQDHEFGAGGHNQTAEVVRAEHLSKAADICHVLGWRKTHYIRCPEVAWAIHGPRTADGVPRGLVRSTDAQIEAVRTALAQSDKTVVELSGIAPSAVGSYLWHINRVVLHEMNPRPPSLSWAFVRTEGFEQDESFWHVLWRIIGAPEEAFEFFRSSPTRDAALRPLIRALNTFEPTREAKAHRAPDIIVIIGPERFDDEEGKTIHSPGARPLAVSPILRELGRSNCLSVCEARRSSSGFSVFPEWLGKTRIILIAEPPTPDSSLHTRITSNDRKILDRLRIFRWSFTQHSAALVLQDLDIKGQQVRDQLDRLKADELLHYFGGEYFLPMQIKCYLESLTEQQDPFTLAERHFAAGTALAPYWNAGEYPALAYDAAFVPERVHEAQYHLIQAGRLFGNQGRKDERKKALKALSQAMRFGQIVNWDAAFGLIRSRDAGACVDAYVFIEDYMEAWRKHPRNDGTPNHPTHLAAAAKALRFFNPGRDIAKRYGHKAAQGEAIHALFLRARDACAAFPAEQDYNLLHVLSEYSEYLYYEYSSRYDEYRSAQAQDFGAKILAVDGDILKMRCCWTLCPGAIRGSWFDSRGDWCDDHGDAGAIYAQGVELTEGHQQLKVKAAGALRLRNKNHSLLVILAGLAENEDEAITICRGAMLGYEREYERRKKLIKKSLDSKNCTSRFVERWDSLIYPRWCAGVEFFQIAWKKFPRCLGILAQFPKWKPVTDTVKQHENQRQG